MRRASYDSVVGFIESNGQLLGFKLGVNWVTEHEIGISGLQSDFKVKKDERVFGLARRKIEHVPGKLSFVVDGNTAALVYRPYQTTAPKLAEISQLECRPRGDSPVGCAWSDRDFGIIVHGADNVAKLRKLHEAFLRKDIAFKCGGKEEPCGPGLNILIYSATPETLLTSLENSDRDTHELNSTAHETGIVDKLKKADKAYFALRPSWASGFTGVKTRHPVVFWLNPMRQDQNNCGWFTVEELEAWIRNEGPIPKTGR